MSWPKEDSSVVTPRVRPTVPMAEAASNRGAHEGDALHAAQQQAPR